MDAANTQTLNLHQRLLLVMQDVSYVQKDTKVQAGRGSYSAVSHDAVTAKVRPALLKHGVVVTADVIEAHEEQLTVTRKGQGGSSYDQVVYRASVRMAVTFTNADAPDQSLVVHHHGTGEDQGDKAIGKAESYAVKYALLKTLMLETGDDTDKDASIQREAQRSHGPQPNDVLAAFQTAQAATSRDEAMEVLTKAAGLKCTKPSDVPAARRKLVIDSLHELAGIPVEGM
jgi:hypothetical protein